MRRIRTRLVTALAGAVVLLAIPGVAPALAGVTLVNVDISFELSGLGSGRVQSLDSDFEPNGLLDCQRISGQPGDPSHCQATVQFPNTGGAIAIRITPGMGSLGCWQGACAPDTRQIVVPITGDTVIEVRFDRQKVDLTVHRTGTGTGNIFGTEGDIECGTRCSVTLEYGYQMLLSAVPDAGSKFNGWTGACAGQPRDCLIALIADTDTTARFALLSGGSSSPPGPTPNPTRAVDSSPAPSVAPSGPTDSGFPEATPTPAPTPGPSPTLVATSGGAGPSLLVLVLGGAGAGLLAAWLVYRLLSSRRRPTPVDGP